MRRLLAVPALALLFSVTAMTSAIAITNGGGSSGDAPGQARAGDQCTAVYADLQVDLRALGGPKSGPSVGPVGTYLEGSGPTNCDHFWQLQEAIGH